MTIPAPYLIGLQMYEIDDEGSRFAPKSGAILAR